MDEKTKLELLRKTVLEQAAAQAEEIEAKTQQIVREKYEQNKRETELEVSEKTTVAEQELKNKLQRQLAQKRGEYRKEVFRTRERYIDDIFADAAKELTALKNSAAYTAYLKRVYSAGCEQLQGCDCIYAAPEDVETVEKTLGGQVVADNSIHIGGIIIEKNRRAVNATFDERLRIERVQFAANGIFSLQED